MEKFKRMLKAHPGFDEKKLEQVDKILKKTMECAITCNICADACISAKNPELEVCIKNNLLCAEICTSTARSLCYTDRTEGALRSLVESCQQICKVCGDECSSHAEKMEHCKVCAASCKECEEACQELLSA